MKQITRWIAALFMLAFCAQAATTNLTVTLVWDPSPSEVIGYKAYWITNAPTQTNFVVFADVGITNTVVTTNKVSGVVSTNTPACSVTLQPGGVYRFYVTCYNSAGLESDPSNIVPYTAPSKPASPTGPRLILQWSTNMIVWVPADILLPDQTQVAYFRLKVSN